MADQPPIAYTALAKGTDVLTSSGSSIGSVEHVLADESLDLFDGLAIRTDAGLRFVDASLVSNITADAVRTTLTDENAADLPRPDGDPVLEADPEEYQGNGLTAWFGRMFMREHWMRDEDK